jgi:hypothetical protein
VSYSRSVCMDICGTFDASLRACVGERAASHSPKARVRLVKWMWADRAILQACVGLGREQDVVEEE